MKKVMLWLIVFVLVSTAALRGQTHAPDITGSWQGTLHIPSGRDLRIIFKISKEDAGGLKLLQYSIDQGGMAFPATAISMQGSTLTFKIGSLGASYEGKLSDDGNSLTGNWTQFNGPMPLSMVRATTETAWVIPPPPVRLAPMAASADPVFEVATIKPSNPDVKGIGFRVNGRHFNTLNTSLMDLLKFAYGVQAKQVVNGPSWIDDAKFDIAAEPDGEGQPNDKQWKIMLQKLLVERFALKFHRDKRELSVYVLTVGKAGSKLTKSQGDPNGLPGFGFPGPGHLIAMNGTMKDYADFLQQTLLDRPAIDQTGLAGRFDFSLEWTPDETQFGGRWRNLPPSDNPKPVLFTAIQEQLGLKLDAVKAPTEVIVIDHVDKPSDN